MTTRTVPAHIADLHTRIIILCSSLHEARVECAGAEHLADLAGQLADARAELATAELEHSTELGQAVADEQARTPHLAYAQGRAAAFDHQTAVWHYAGDVAEIGWRPAFQHLVALKGADYAAGVDTAYWATQPQHTGEVAR